MERQIGLFILVVGISLIFCCKPSPQQEEGEEVLKVQEEVEVTLWHSYRESEKSALEQIVNQLNSSNLGVRVKLLNVPYDAFIDKVTIATPRGQGPDLFIFAHNMIGEWVERHHIIEPISDRVPRETLKRFIPSTVKALVYKQSLYGLPLAFKSLALFYNTDLIKSPPDNHEQLIEMAKATTNVKEGKYGLVYEAGLLYFNAPFIHGFGGQILDAEGNPRVSEKPVVDAITFVRSLAKEGVLPSGINSAMVSALFNEGKAAMVISGPWFIGEIDKSRQYQVSLLPVMPTGIRARPYLGSEAIFLSSYSKKKDAALKVMEYLTSDSSALVRLKVGRQTVANASIYDRDDVKQDRIMTIFRAQAENAVLMPSIPEMQVVWSTMDMAINKSVFGDTDPKEALNEASLKINADIAKMRR